MEYSERDRLLRGMLLFERDHPLRLQLILLVRSIAFRQHLDERKEKRKGSGKKKSSSGKKSKKSKSSKSSKSKKGKKGRGKDDEDPLAKLDTGW